MFFKLTLSFHVVRVLIFYIVSSISSINQVYMVLQFYSYVSYYHEFTNSAGEKPFLFRCQNFKKFKNIYIRRYFTNNFSFGNTPSSSHAPRRTFNFPQNPPPKKPTTEHSKTAFPKIIK